MSNDRKKSKVLDVEENRRLMLYLSKVHRRSWKMISDGIEKYGVEITTDQVKRFALPQYMTTPQDPELLSAIGKWVLDALDRLGLELHEARHEAKVHWKAQSPAQTKDARRESADRNGLVLPDVFGKMLARSDASHVMNDVNPCGIWRGVVGAGNVITPFFLVVAKGNPFMAFASVERGKESPSHWAGVIERTGGCFIYHGHKASGGVDRSRLMLAMELSVLPGRRDMLKKGYRIVVENGAVNMGRAAMTRLGSIPYFETDDTAEELAANLEKKFGEIAEQLVRTDYTGFPEHAIQSICDLCEGEDELFSEVSRFMQFGDDDADPAEQDQLLE